jgi:beta-RFAP synthase
MTVQKKHISETETVEVIAPARLHLGFMDMHGGMGRNYGSLGLCLSEICTHLTARHSDVLTIEGPSSERARKYAEQTLVHFDIENGVRITIHEAIPEHAGLGSGTQLSLAVATSIVKLFDLNATVSELASLHQRGARSGIGIGTFTMGGFLVDGGLGKDTDIPPIISHNDFPQEWRIPLIFDKQMQGVSGSPERVVFKQLPPMDECISQALCRLVLMQALPSLVEKDCVVFGKAITEIQETVGDHFAEVQGGRYSSPLVIKLLPWLTEQGATGVGQSSWGPTGFALFANETDAFQVMRKTREIWRDEPGLGLMLCKARNNKADIFTSSRNSTHNKLQMKSY